MMKIISNGILFCEKHFKKCILVYALAQLALLFKFPLPYSSDSAYFFRLVQEWVLVVVHEIGWGGRHRSWSHKGETNG